MILNLLAASMTFIINFTIREVGMKTKLPLFVLFFFLGVGLCYAQTAIGTVSFLLGESEYTVEGSTDWKKLKIDDKIQSDWILKTGKDSELEITWDNGESSSISANTTIKVLDLIKDLKVETEWLDRVKNKLSLLLSSTDDNKVQGVAGVRREAAKEVEQDSIYWMKLKEADFNEGYEAFRNNDFDKSITIFEEVVNQSPLSKRAEIARACLITMYKEKGEEKLALKHLNSFMKDFPESDMTELLQEVSK